jgi:hypothetical protein
MTDSLGFFFKSLRRGIEAMVLITLYTVNTGF